MYRKFFSILIAALISVFSFAQPKLKVVPDKIEFKSQFDRLKNMFFINEGTDTLSIDSIYYNNYNVYSNFYFIRFDIDSHFPIHIAPNDTIKMDCILTNYYYIPPIDTSDNMLIYSNGVNTITDIKINSYYRDTGGWGTISGNITGSSQPINNALVYIMHNGSSIADTISTDASGFFSLKVPNGLYTVAAKKDSFYTTFYGQTFSPYLSRIINLKKNDIVNVSIDLPKMINTGFSICGQIIDSISESFLSRAMIIATKGRHVPSKVNSIESDSVPTNIYTAFINPDGTYEIDNIKEPGYYLIQSFSDYYVPSYYKSGNTSSPFWEKADSIYIGADTCGLNIFMPRDSSVGNGTISGIVAINQGTGDNFSDIIIFAQSLDNYFIFNHAVVENDGKFTIYDLPYGHYRLIAQKVGNTSIYNDELTIDSLNTDINNIEINFDIAGIDKGKIIPNTPVLYQNYPNPFNPTTNFEFRIANRGFVTLKIYDVLGREAAVLLNEEKSTGNYKITFNASGLASGVYFYQLKTAGFVSTKKFVLIK